MKCVLSGSHLRIFQGCLASLALLKEIFLQLAIFDRLRYRLEVKSTLKILYKLENGAKLLKYLQCLSTYPIKMKDTGSRQLWGNYANHDGTMYKVHLSSQLLIVLWLIIKVHIASLMHGLHADVCTCTRAMRNGQYKQLTRTTDKATVMMRINRLSCNFLKGV